MTTEYTSTPTFRCEECQRDRWISETISFGCGHRVCVLCLMSNALDGGASQPCQVCKRQGQPREQRAVAPF